MKLPCLSCCLHLMQTISKIHIYCSDIKYHTTQQTDIQLTGNIYRKTENDADTIVGIGAAVYFIGICRSINLKVSIHHES